MRSPTSLAIVLPLTAFALVSTPAQANTINVTTSQDEDNGNLSGHPPVGQGCSLREALQAIVNGAAYRGCSAPTVGGPNTIDLTNAGGTIVINSLVPDPSGAPGNVRNGNLPFISSAMGTVIIGNGTVTCDASPNGVRIFQENSGAALTLTALSLGTVAQGCTTGGGGIGIWNTGGDLTLNGVSFTNIHSNDGGQGAALLHSGGTLNINGGNFTGNGTSDTSNPSAETGDGGAIYMSNVGLPSIVNMDGVTFTANSAANRGGAIFWTNSDTLGHNVTIKGAIFTGNTAKGGAGGNERGGGAIYASIDSDHSPTNLDLFLIVNGQFTLNTAPNGQGGAILLAGGLLSSIDIITNPLDPQPAPFFPATGGIVASDFWKNSAGGAASADALGGAGGAIYARGFLSVVQSSFRTNSSTNGSGGAVALRNTSTPNLAAFANVTFTGNTAKQAGGAIANLHSNGTLSLINDTLAGNTAAGDTTAGNTIADGGAVYNANPTVTDVGVRNTIFGASTPSVNCAGSPVNDLGNNLQYSPNTTSCGASMTIGNPNLAAASIFAGPNVFVWTMAINGDHSPAQGAGDQPTCSAQPIVNIDGTGRLGIRPSPSGESCDIGAYESTTSVPVLLQEFDVD